VSRVEIICAAAGGTALGFLAHTPTLLQPRCQFGDCLSNQEVVENSEARGQEKGIRAGERDAINLMD